MHGRPVQLLLDRLNPTSNSNNQITRTKCVNANVILDLVTSTQIPNTPQPGIKNTSPRRLEK